METLPEPISVTFPVDELNLTQKEKTRNPFLRVLHHFRLFYKIQHLIFVQLCQNNELAYPVSHLKSRANRLLCTYTAASTNGFLSAYVLQFRNKPQFLCQRPRRQIIFPYPQPHLIRFQTFLRIGKRRPAHFHTKALLMIRGFQHILHFQYAA